MLRVLPALAHLIISTMSTADQQRVLFKSQNSRGKTSECVLLRAFKTLVSTSSLWDFVLFWGCVCVCVCV